MDQADNAKEPDQKRNPSQAAFIYEIRVQERLESHWSDWFNGLDVTPQENGETLITGPIPDQAALQGILNKVFNLRLILISVKRTHPGSQP